MRVAYVLKQYPRYSETFIVNEILAHEAAGWELDIFSLRPCHDSHFQDAIAQVRAPVHYVPTEAKTADFWGLLDEAARRRPGGWAGLESLAGADARDALQGMWLARAVTERGIEHLHAHFATVATTVARLAAQLAGISFSFTAHAKDIFHESVSRQELGEKLSAAAVAVTVSEFNLAYLHSHYGAAGARAVRIYNGLDLERFAYRSPLRRTRTIVAVGRLVEKKGFDVLIEACAHLAARRSDFVCKIIGSGELEAVLAEEVRRLGLQDFVELCGPRPQAEVVSELRQAAALAAPCIIGRDGNRDGLPTVLLEAMALGTPVVATDVTGIPEIVHHEETGLLVPQHNVERLAEALERLLDNGKLRAEMASRARQLVEEEFDIHKNTARLRALFVHRSRAPRTVVEELV